jgi:hypothetical protein
VPWCKPVICKPKRTFRRVLSRGVVPTTANKDDLTLTDAEDWFYCQGAESDLPRVPLVPVTFGMVAAPINDIEKQYKHCESEFRFSQRKTAPEADR